MMVLLTDAYKDKLQLFHKLKTISLEMADFSPESLLVDDGALETFQKLLQERESVIRSIDATTKKIKQLERLAEDLEQFKDLRTAWEAEAVQVAELNPTLENIAQTVVAELRKRTRQVREGLHSNRAYEQRVSASEGAFIDKRR